MYLFSIPDSDKLVFRKTVINKIFLLFYDSTISEYYVNILFQT